MKKMQLLCFAALLAVSLIQMSGCSYNNTDVPAVVDNSSLQQKDPQQPHEYSDFLGPGVEFKGGNAVTDYSLSLVRRVDHPELIRLVFEFAGKVEDTAASPPEYSVKMENEKKISMRLRGVVKEEVMKNKSDILSLSELIEDVVYIQESKDEAVVNLSFKSPLKFQVFDLAKPARVVVVLRPETR